MSAAPRGRATAVRLIVVALLLAACNATVPPIVTSPPTPTRPPATPAPTRGRVRARRLSGCGRRSMRPEGAARRDPRGLSGRAQAHPGDRREDRRLRAVPARRRLPDEDRVTGLRDQRHGLDLAPRQAGWGGRAGHRQRGQRDRTVQARALGSRQRGEPCAERRLHPHARRQRAGDRPLATRSGPTGVGAAGRDGRRRRRPQSVRVRDRGRRCQPRARATEGVERRLPRLHPERRPVQQRDRPPGAGPRHRPREDRRRTVPAELRGAHPLHAVRHPVRLRRHAVVRLRSGPGARRRSPRPAIRRASRPPSTTR